MTDQKNLSKGWADSLGQAIKGDAPGFQVLRARGAKPMRIDKKEAELQACRLRGARKRGKAGSRNRAVERVFAAMDQEET